MKLRELREQLDRLPARADDAEVIAGRKVLEGERYPQATHVVYSEELNLVKICTTMRPQPS